MDKTFAIAIDGPVAAGKGTIAVRLANVLKGFHLYTGAMYRCLAFLCLEKNIDLHDIEAVVAVLPEMNIAFEGDTILLNGQDVTEKLKEQGPAAGSSVVAVDPRVRAAMVLKQQEIAHEALQKGKIVISEGRDTATKVLPDAALKVYLTARDEVRAKRRLLQYQQQGREVTFEEVLAEIRERDKRDLERSADPLPSDPKALGYFVLDDSNQSEEETVQMIHNELKKRKLV